MNYTIGLKNEMGWTDVVVLTAGSFYKAVSKANDYLKDVIDHHKENFVNIADLSKFNSLCAWEVVSIVKLDISEDHPTQRVGISPKSNFVSIDMGGRNRGKVRYVNFYPDTTQNMNLCHHDFSFYGFEGDIQIKAPRGTKVKVSKF